MSIPVTDLTENDYKILEYISRFKSVALKDIEAHFAGKIDAIGYHISILKKPEVRTLGHGLHLPIENSNYISEEYEKIESSDSFGDKYVSKNSFHITSFGRATLQEYTHKRHSDKKALFLNGVWLPIIVTVSTNAIIYGLKLLFPLILQWFSRVWK